MAQSLFVPTVRPLTTDAEIWRNVFDDNAYGLSEFASDEVIIDVGAHIGAFTFACMARGGRMILAFEPYPESYSLAQLNVWRFATDLGHPDLPQLYGCSIWRSDRAETVSITRAPDSLFSNRPHPAANSTLFQTDHSLPVVSFALDAVLKHFDRVSLLKLDCEGAEWPILWTSKELHRVDNLAIELHSFPWKSFELKQNICDRIIAEFGRLNTEQLVMRLKEFGFRCTWSNFQKNLFRDARFYYGQVRFARTAG